MIHVCFCFHDKTGHYAKFAGIAMLSLFENTNSEVTVHVLHDDTLTDNNRDKLFYIAGRYKQHIKLYNLSELCPDKISAITKLVPEIEKAPVTVGAFYKLLIQQVLPEEIKKAIFIDPDTIINLDISELWQIELADKVLSAVTEATTGTNPKKAFLLCSDGIVKGEDYFNCGVMLMNLNLLRNEEETIMQGIEFRGKNPTQKYFEQTVLNYCFSKRIAKLPLKFNCPVRVVRQSKEPVIERKIYHYASGSSRPGLEMEDIFNRLWMNYFIKSPFFDVEVFGQFYARIKKIRSNLKDTPFKLSAIMPGKMRAFFIEPKDLETMTKLFAIKDYEEVILAENKESAQKLIDAMYNFKGTCVFFILTDKFLKKKTSLELLKNEGFIEDKDFVKAWTFLPESSSSYPLIQEM